MTTRARERNERSEGTIVRAAWTTTPVDYDIAASDPTGAQRPSLKIFVGAAGNLAVTDLSGTNSTITGIVAGTVLELQLTALVATGSTAQNVSVIW